MPTPLYPDIEVAEGIRIQATWQNRAYVIDLSGRASAPTNPSILEAVDEADPDTDLQGTIFSGTVSVNGTSLTTPRLMGTQLSAGKTYRTVCIWDEQGNQDGVYFRIYVPL